MKNWQILVLLMVLIVSLGAVLRFYDLGRNSFWSDELKTIGDASTLTSVKAFFTPSGNAHPKLYFLLLHGWMQLGAGDFFLRSLGVIFGLLLIVATFFLGQELYNSRIGLLAAFAVAISPYHLLYDRELRMYSLFAFLSIASLYFLWRALRDNNRTAWGMYTLFTTLNLYTHYHAMLLIFAQWVYLLFSWGENKRSWVKMLFANIVAFMFYAPWLTNGLYFHMQNVATWSRRQEILPAKGFLFLAKPLYVIYGLCLGQTLLPWKFWGIIGILSFFTLGVIALAVAKKHNNCDRFILIMVTTVLIAGSIFSAAMPRYYIMLAPLIYILLLALIDKVAIKNALYVLLFIILICWSVGLANYYQGRDFHVMAHADPWKAVGRYLEQNVRPNDIIVFVGKSSSLAYYYKAHPLWQLDDKAFGDLKRHKLYPKHASLWLLTSDPVQKQLADKVTGWFDGNYARQGEKRYQYDPDYKNKAKYLNKEFLEYRISVYQYRSK